MKSFYNVCSFHKLEQAWSSSVFAILHGVLGVLESDMVWEL